MRRATLVFIIVLLLLQPLGAIVLFVTRNQNIAYLAFLPSFLWLVLQLAYRYWDWLYLMVEKARLHVLGRGVSLGLRADYSVDDADKRLPAAITRLKELWPTRQLAGEAYRVVLEVNEVTLVIAATAAVPTTTMGIDDTRSTITVELVRHPWPFRRALQLVNDFAPSVLEELHRTLSPLSEKYVAEITFGESNPYFGFFVRNIQLKNIDRFVVELHVSLPGDPRPVSVTATKDKVTLVAWKATSLSTSTRRYLALAAT